jgi:putative transposase
MLNILTFLDCLEPEIDQTTLRRLSRIILALLGMNGRVTMLGISRWAGKGGSYRSIQRYFSSVIPWATMMWIFFRAHLLQSDETYVLAGDEVVTTKAGKATHGLGRFFSSIENRAVPGLAFFALSVVAVGARRAYPIALEQVIRPTSAPSGKSKAAAAAKRPSPAQRGRPKGSKNRDKTQVPLSDELQLISRLLGALLQRFSGWLKVRYVVLDGHFGHAAVGSMLQRHQLEIISKLRHDSILYLPYQGTDKRRKYGEQLDYNNLPPHLLKHCSVDINTQLQSTIYQGQLLHRQFDQPLNVVIWQKTNLKTKAVRHIILFSSDLELGYEALIDFYQLRFQIEFNFRDAKQFWGLEDFMNISPTAVTNAANLSMFMVTLSQFLLQQFRQTHPDAGILDLKAYARGLSYAQEVIKLLPQKPAPHLLVTIFLRLSQIGHIHKGAVQSSLA